MLTNSAGQLLVANLPFLENARNWDIKKKQAASTVTEHVVPFISVVDRGTAAICCDQDGALSIFINEQNILRELHKEVKAEQSQADHHLSGFGDLTSPISALALSIANKSHQPPPSTATNVMRRMSQTYSTLSEGPVIQPEPAPPKGGLPDNVLSEGLGGRTTSSPGLQAAGTAETDNPTPTTAEQKDPQSTD